jgi:hypothetical protein
MTPGSSIWLASAITALIRSPTSPVTTSPSALRHHRRPKRDWIMSHVNASFWSSNRKQAWLLAMDLEGKGDQEALDVTAQAERTFLRDHLGHFGRAFGASLAANGVGMFYSAVGSTFLRFLDAACARAGVDGGPAGLIVRPDLVDDTPMMCGSAEDLIQIQRHP